MPRKVEPEMQTPALRMPEQATPDHQSRAEVTRHVGALRGISPETLRTWARRKEIDAGLSPGINSGAELEI